MKVDNGYRVVTASAIKAALDSGATWELWSGSEPELVTEVPTGTMLANEAVSAAQVSVNSATGVLTLSNLSDSAINTTGNPTFFRVKDDQLKIQLSAKMAADSTTAAEVVVTDQDDLSATQILQNRRLTLTINLN